MSEIQRLFPRIAALSLAVALTACGGGGGGNDSSSSTFSSAQSADPATSQQAQTQTQQEPNAPTFTGNTANDGFNWFNFRRQQTGLTVLGRSTVIDTAALGHSNYQRANDTISHEQTLGNPSYTGATLGDRLQAAGYVFTSQYAYGEVISATGDTSGFNAAEDLIAAIYHRFVIFEPMFKEGGAGSATVPNGYTYFTTNFAANGLGAGLGRGGFVTYPAQDQQRVAINFFSDREIPDPMPAQNEVGYPVSIHADITAVVTVQSFTINARGGPQLAVRLLTRPTDSNTPRSAAAIVPYAPLAPATTYDVRFVGSIDGVAANRTWSFTTL